MISVIVLNWNGHQHLEGCLSALTRQTYDAYEVIVVDNGSTDVSVDFITENYPKVRVIPLTRNLGFSAGNNVGIQQSAGEFVALINNDTEADSAWLSEGIGALQRNPEAGFIASRIRLFNLRNHLDTAGDLYFRTGYPGKRGWLMTDGLEFAREEWVWGACAGAAIYRRSMLDDIGLLDEDFFAYMEDTDLNFRAQLMGYKCLYVPKAIVYHKVSATAGRQSPQRLYWSHRNHWYTLIKNLPTSLWPLYLGQIIAAETLIMGAAIRTGRLGVFVKARAHVLCMLPKMIKKRQEIQQRRRVSVDYIDSLIRRDWFSFRLAAKKRETKHQTNTRV